MGQLTVGSNPTPSATGPSGLPPRARPRLVARHPTTITAELELVTRKAGDRIGGLRVLARTAAQAQVDPLTDLPNRRTLEDRTHDLLEHDTEFVVAYADLDHFKNLNDLHGHDTGDRALRLFARVLRDSIRPRDIPARYGGEEFVVVRPDCSIADARDVAERVRSELTTALGAATLPDFTVSVGLASAESGEALSEVIDRADSALFQAKQLGRDRVVIAGETTPGGQPPSPRRPSADQVIRTGRMVNHLCPAAVGDEPVCSVSPLPSTAASDRDTDPVVNMEPDQVRAFLGLLVRITPTKIIAARDVTS